MNTLTLLLAPLADGPAMPAIVQHQVPCDVHYVAFGPPLDMVAIDAGPWSVFPALSDGEPSAVMIRSVSFTLDGQPFDGVEAEVVSAHGSSHAIAAGPDRLPDHLFPIPGIDDMPHHPVPIPNGTLAAWRECAIAYDRCRRLAEDAYRIRYDGCLDEILAGGLAGGSALGGGGAVLGGSIWSVPGAAVGGVVGCAAGFAGGAWFAVDRCRDNAMLSLRLDMNRCRREEQWCVEDHQ